MADPVDPLSPLSAIEAEVSRSLKTAALAVERRLRPLEGAVLAYRRALEAEVAREYAAAHSLRWEPTAGASRAAAARALHELVLALPELAPAPATDEPSRPTFENARAPADPAPPLASDPAQRSLAEVLPQLAARASEQTLVVIGALGGRKRNLPEPLAARTEWLDTTQGGAHAVGNLPARIRQGRVLGVVICDQVVSHKHTEPVLAAARAAGVPVGFAGKGGNAGLARALRAIEEQLGAPRT